MGYSFTFQFSEKDIDFNPRADRFFNYSKFLLNEFFNATDQQFEEIMKGYKNKFGLSAYYYVMNNYAYGWRRGGRTLSNVQENRILAIMPDFLTEIAKQKLEKTKEEARYKLGIEEVTTIIKKSVEAFFSIQGTIYSKYNVVTEENMISIFQKEFERAKALQTPEYFSKTNYDRILILNEAEEAEAISIARYIVYIKLQNQFNQIVKDFNTFLPYAKSLNRGIFKAFYKIFSFKIDIEIAKAKFSKISIPNYKIKEVETNSRFKEYADKYLAYELINIRSETNKAVVDAFLNDNDIKLFFEHYKELATSDNEINMRSTFTGEGGILNLELRMKPIKMLRTAIAKSIVKLLIYTIVLGGIVTWISANNLWGTIFFGFLFIGGFYISLVDEEIKQIKLLRSELKLYGQ